MSKPIEASEMLDSRDIIERLEELTEHFGALHEQETEDGETVLAFGEWVKTLPDDDLSYEFTELLNLQNECESCPDWYHGEQLIREDYFEDYIEEMIKECYPIPKEMDSGEWPFRHFYLNYEAAAKEAEYDYNYVSFMNKNYLIRA
jgi:hypothetical protein